MMGSNVGVLDVLWHWTSMTDIRRNKIARKAHGDLFIIVYEYSFDELSTATQLQFNCSRAAVHCDGLPVLDAACDEVDPVPDPNSGK